MTSKSSLNKRIHLCTLLLLLLGGSCVKKSTLDQPGGGATDSQNVSIGFLKTQYKGYATPLNKALEIKGIVTANDKFGSFPNTLVVEDQTGGIEIKVGDALLHRLIHVGESVLVRCQGLVLGDYGGMVSLGAPSKNEAYENSFIPEELTLTHIKGSGEIQEVLPRRVTIAALQPSEVGRFVALEQVQFIDQELALSWGDPQADCDRHLVDQKGDTLPLRILHTLGFVNQLLPQGSGYIEGILSYFNQSYQLRPISNKGAVMESTRFPVAARPKSCP